MSESERGEWERLVGQRFLGMLKELFNVRGQRPVLQALIARLTIPDSKEDLEPREKNYATNPGGLGEVEAKT